MSARPASIARAWGGMIARGLALGAILGAVCAWRVHPATWSRDELVAWWEREADERLADLKLSFLVETLERKGDRDAAGALMAHAMTADLRLGAGERFERRLAAHIEQLAASPQFGEHLHAWIEESLAVGDVARAERLFGRFDRLDAAAWAGVRDQAGRQIRLTRALLVAEDHASAGKRIETADPVWALLTEYVASAPRSTPDVRNAYFTHAALGRRAMGLFAALRRTNPDLIAPFAAFIDEWTRMNPDDTVTQRLRAQNDR